MLTLSDILMFFDITLNYFIFNKQSVHLQIYQIYTKFSLLTSIEKNTLLINDCHIINSVGCKNSITKKWCLKCLNVNPMGAVNNILCIERTVHPDPGYGYGCSNGVLPGFDFGCLY